METPQDKPTSVEQFNELPNQDVLNSLSPELHKAVVNKFLTQEVKPAEPKETPVVEESKTEDITQKSDTSSKPISGDDQPEDWKENGWKRYKDLQRAYTKNNQEHKEEKESFLAKLDDIEERLSSKETPKEEIVEDNSEDETLEDKVQKIVERTIKPVMDKITHKEMEANEDIFREGIAKFLTSDLAELEPELNSFLQKEFGSHDKALDAARKDPNLFSRIRATLIDQNFDKAYEVKSKKLKNPQDGVKDVQDTGVSGKPRTTTPAEPATSTDEMLKKLPLEEHKKALDKMGLVDPSAKRSKYYI